MFLPKIVIYLLLFRLSVSFFSPKMLSVSKLHVRPAMVCRCLTGVRTASAFSKPKFWSKTINLNVTNDKVNLISTVSQLLQKEGGLSSDFPSIESGVAIFPKYGTMVPIEGNMLKETLSIKLPAQFALANQNKNSEAKSYPVTICAFVPQEGTAAQRGAVREAIDPLRGGVGKDRPFDLERMITLDLALYNLSAEEFGGSAKLDLLSDAYCGTPPARIYRSFVCPRDPRERAERRYPELIDQAAKRTALQIQMALRKLRADRALFLRNTDRTRAAAATGAADVSSVPIGGAGTQTGTDTGTISSEEEEAVKNKGKYASSSSEQLETSHKDASTAGGTSADATAVEEGVAAAAVPVTHPMVLVLDNIRSAFNVGSLFRTAETAGVAELITCGITAHPPHPKLQKTALGSTESVATRHFQDILAAIQALRKEGYTIVAMETTSLSKNYVDVQYPRKLAIVVGNEITGVDTRVMDLVDMIVEIPTYGLKNSLNVASAAPIMLFEVLRQWHTKAE
jgi:23S rRNA (guanosine2251-2'-O)-methyltransferase